MPFNNNKKCFHVNMVCIFIVAQTHTPKTWLEAWSAP